MKSHFRAPRVPLVGRTLTLILLVAAALVFADAPRAELEITDTKALEALMAQGVSVVDVRTRGEWQETGIIEGAHSLTFFDDTGQYDWDAWLARLREIAGPDEPVVLMCHSGNRSAVISKALRDKAGYTQVYDYTPGISGWLAHERPTVPVQDASR